MIVWLCSLNVEEGVVCVYWTKEAEKAARPRPSRAAAPPYLLTRTEKQLLLPNNMTCSLYSLLIIKRIVIRELCTISLDLTCN